jgi:hypothetical protein
MKAHRTRYLSLILAFVFFFSACADSLWAQASDVVAAPSMAGKTSFLDFPGKLSYHKLAGWTSTGLLLAAGGLGVARALDLMNRGHEIRSGLGISEEDNSAIAGYLGPLWADGQALRWLHVGFIAAGETLYLGNALTGLSMKIPAKERTINSNIHLIGFFTHAALMATEVVLGVLTSDALRRGDHEAHIGLATAHAAVGIAIPLVMATAGYAATSDLSFLQGSK